MYLQIYVFLDPTVDKERGAESSKEEPRTNSDERMSQRTSW